MKITTNIPMSAVSVRADLMPKEIRREVSRLEKEPTSGIRLPIFLPHTHPWLDKSRAGTTLARGECSAQCSRLPDQTRPCQCPLPLFILTRAHFKGAVICKRRWAQQRGGFLCSYANPWFWHSSHTVFTGLEESLTLNKLFMDMTRGT